MQITRFSRAMRALADAMFANAMIPHHQSAIEMAEMVTSSGASPAVTKLAQAIIAAQTDEIEMMEKWRVPTGAARRRKPVRRTRYRTAIPATDGAAHLLQQKDPQSAGLFVGSSFDQKPFG